MHYLQCTCNFILLLCCSLWPGCKNWLIWCCVKYLPYFVPRQSPHPSLFRNDIYLTFHHYINQSIFSTFMHWILIFKSVQLQIIMFLRLKRLLSTGAPCFGIEKTNDLQIYIEESVQPITVWSTLPSVNFQTIIKYIPNKYTILYTNFTLFHSFDNILPSPFSMTTRISNKNGP